MHRIDTPTAQKDKFGAGKNGFTKGNPQTGTPATEIDETIFDAVQEEICAVIEGEGLALNKSDRGQLYKAIKKIIVNLDLKSASKRDVGTGQNQIPDMNSFSAVLSIIGSEKSPGGAIKQWVGGGLGLIPAGGSRAITLPFPFPSGILIAIPFTGATAPGFSGLVGIKWDGRDKVIIYNSSMTAAIADFGVLVYGV